MMELFATKNTHFQAPYALFCRSTPSLHSPKLQLSIISLPRSKLRYLQFQSHFGKPLFSVPKPTHRPRLELILCSNSSNALSTEKKSWVEVVGEAVSTAFPAWVALGCFLGLVRPSSFNWVQPKWTVMGITITMLGMGMTLTFDDLRGAFAMPKELLAGFVLQYSKKKKKKKKQLIYCPSIRIKLQTKQTFFRIEGGGSFC